MNYQPGQRVRKVAHRIGSLKPRVRIGELGTVVDAPVPRPSAVAVVFDLTLSAHKTGGYACEPYQLEPVQDKPEPGSWVALRNIWQPRVVRA
jgi:hypothetical protein